jgi:CheY-like chemotaxis protein
MTGDVTSMGGLPGARCQRRTARADTISAERESRPNVNLSARLAAANEPITVLIADDDPSIRTLLRFTLADRNLRLLEAENGAEALRLVREARPRLVLLDIDMPELDGLEVCTTIKSDPQLASTVVVLITGRTDMVDIFEGERTGADRYLTKPFSPLELRSLLDIYLVREIGGGAA